MNNLLFNPSCCETINHSKIKLEENNIKVIFDNISNEDFIKIKIDGCEITDNNIKKADYLLQKQQVGQIIIELKGQDISRAVAQIESTIPYVKARSDLKIVALIVYGKSPEYYNDKVKTKLVEDFRKKNKVTLDIKKSSNENLNFDGYF